MFRRPKHLDQSRSVDVVAVPHPKGAFSWVMDPKAISVLCALAWIFVSAAGFDAVTSQPRIITNELGPIITNIWAVMFVTGGILAVVGALPGWWYLERSGIILLVAGLTVYDATLWYLETFVIDGHRSIDALIYLAFIFLALARLSRISGATLDPGRGDYNPPDPLTVNDDEDDNHY